MKYMGSKNRIAKYLLPIILKDRKETNLIKELKKYYQSFQSWADLKEELSNDSSIKQQINNPKKFKI